MKGVERTNMVMTWPQQRTRFTQRNSYAMDVDRRKNRNCYNYRGFRHLARNCRNRRTGNRIGEGRRLEYEGNGKQNLNGERDLILLD